jgi:hypothetical protein
MTNCKIGIDLAEGKDTTEVMVLEKKDKNGEINWEPNWGEMKKFREQFEFYQEVRRHIYEYCLRIPKDKI